MGDRDDATAPAAIQRPTDRYGKQPSARPRWLAPALIAAVAVLGCGVAFLGWQKYGPKDIESEQLGYVVVDDATMSIRIKVTRKDPQQPVVCFVRAMARDSVEVGRREVLIPPSDSGTIQLTTTVKASERPASSSIYACSADVPEYLRAE
ncbi:DUF4307 domain-containing protein [Nocardia brasiliensis]|uniref:DUF4307 domain-containing protein n=1 Tax=Nocardia brasiliensis (strain ATCC 700358 / HUJEG-1) TaxID=1133849 RepID=K0F6C6_NOCB7|nr:DUF4307 domain-containing protein [Nocardia brasiliensis]AFU05237.1 hypothetical protein O3I_036450 [Nocardia brasiliensis ATCC 700358]MBF6124348.1 DUF4307 domain-containing protein [Nocardia brasiliensis]MBF6544159.1 DUF4307 domain-containing protein [Nocardia brasiliensis]OCF88038.1 hypothetical protein AW168_23690 [Nocardia brasiliensis]